MIAFKDRKRFRFAELNMYINSYIEIVKHLRSALTH